MYMDTFSGSQFKKVMRMIGMWVAILVVVIVVGGALWVFGPSIIGWTRTLPLASEVHFFAGTGAERSLYELGIFAPKKITFTLPGQLVDYAKKGDVEAGIVVTDAAKNSEELFLLGAAPVALTSDSKVKGTPSVSADGKRIAYVTFAVPAGKSLKAAIASSAPEDWEVHILSVDTKEIQTVGKGYAPQFFTENGKENILITVNTGFSVLGADGAFKYTYPLLNGVPKVATPVVVSGDGHYIATHAASNNNIELFKLEYGSSVFPTLFSQGVFPPSTYSVTFHKGDVYGLKVANNEKPKLIIGSLAANAGKAYPIRDFQSLTPYRLSI